MATIPSIPDQMNAKDVQSVLEYLLVSQLNLTNRDEPGPAGSSRLISLFFHLLNTLGAPAVFCDVGANDGSTGAAAKKLFPATRVLSLEANPEIHGMHVNRLTSQGVEYLNLAASAASGSVPIFVPRTVRYTTRVNGEAVTSSIPEPANTGRSSMLKRAEDATYEQFLIPSTSLDALLGPSLSADSSRNVALWIDVEGAAYDVLLGADRSLEKVSAIFIESESVRFWQGQRLGGDVARFLIAKGFVPLSRDREYGDQQFNTLFVHSSFVQRLLPSLYQIHLRPSSTPSSRVETAPRKRRYGSLGASLLTDVPVYITSTSNPAETGRMMAQLRARNLHNLVLLDSGCSSEATSRFLDGAAQDCQVVKVDGGGGHVSLFEDPDTLACLPDVFCVASADLLFAPEMPEDFVFTLFKLTSRFEAGKASLSVSDPEEFAKLPGKMIAGTKTREPLGQLEDGTLIYEATADCTFTLYHKKYMAPGQAISGLSLAGRYACRHMRCHKEELASAVCRTA